MQLKPMRRKRSELTETLNDWSARSRVRYNLTDNLLDTQLWVIQEPLHGRALPSFLNFIVIRKPRCNKTIYVLLREMPGIIGAAG